MGIMDKLKLGKHYRMERFSMMFCTLLVCLFAVTGFCAVTHMHQQDNSLVAKAVYSTKFELSRTGATGTVEDVYTSKDKTKTLLLMRFDDPDKVSMNAKNYQMFLTGASVERNKQTLDGKPSGSIYMFGNTGYMGVYLVNQAGFGPQILDLTIRANTELSAIPKSSDVDSEVEDASFAKHDQLRVYFNPGGSEANTLDCLNGSSAPSVTDFYNEAVIKDLEGELHTRLAAELDQLRVDLTNIEEMEDRAVNAGLKLPTRPEAIDGDIVESEMKDDVRVLTYKPKTVLPGGYNLDWQHESVVDGFLDKLIAKTDTPNMTVDQFFAMMAREKNGDSSKNQFDIDYDWTTTDGTLVEDLNGSNSTRYTELTKLTQAVEQSYRNYYGDKKAYQQESLSELLVLEMQADGVKTNASINTEDNVLQCY